MKRNLCYFLLLAALLTHYGCGARGFFTPAAVSPEQLESRMQAVLLTALNSDTPETRFHALESLSHRGGGKNKPDIRKLLYDSIPAVRFAATLAVGDIQDFAARNRLGELLSDKNQSVRMGAAYALEKMGDDRFGKWYEDFLFGQDSKLTSQACLILGKLGNTPLRPNSKQKLWQVLRRKGQKTSVQLQAAEALARLEDQMVLKPLLAFAGSSFADDRILAISGLAHLKGPDAHAMLSVRAEDPQIEVQLAAIRALGAKATDTDRKVVRKALHYKDENEDHLATIRVRGLAVLALGKVGQKRDTTIFYKMMNTESDYISIAAARAAIDYLRRSQNKEIIKKM